MYNKYCIALTPRDSPSRIPARIRHDRRIAHFWIQLVSSQSMDEVAGAYLEGFRHRLGIAGGDCLQSDFNSQTCREP